MNRLLSTVLFLSLVQLAIGQSFSFNRFPTQNSIYESFLFKDNWYCVAEEDWNPDLLGNHRAVIEIPKMKNNGEVLVNLLWRRPDLNPEFKSIIIKERTTGKLIENFHIHEFSSEKCIIAFEPLKNKYIYEIYYLPYNFLRKWHDARYGEPWNHYIESKTKYLGNTVTGQIENLTQAKVLRFESRTNFESFTSMGLIATKEEELALKGKFKTSYVVFGEDRAFPIRLRKNLPVKWIKDSNINIFKGYAQRNEYYTLQLGIWAFTDTLENISFDISDFKSSTATIPKSHLTCFNTSGIDYKGDDISFKVDIPKDEIQPFWFGIDIPINIPSDIYSGIITVSASNAKDKIIVPITIYISNEIIPDRGDHEPWRHSRLRWLNSTIGIDNNNLKDLPKVEIHDKLITVGNKIIKLANSGLPWSIVEKNKELLHEAITFEIVDSTGNPINFTNSNFTITYQATGIAQWKSQSNTDEYTLICRGSIESDGFLKFKFSLNSKNPRHLKNVRIKIPHSVYSSKYFMGLGHSGGLSPTVHDFNWNQPYDSYWAGEHDGGLHVEFRGGSYHGPLLNDYRLKPSHHWYNDGKGIVKIVKEGDGNLEMISQTSDLNISSEAKEFELGILITPSRELNIKKQFNQRYFHAEDEHFVSAARDGANIINIHHARRLNPIINYPFLVTDSLISFINRMHEKNLKVKLYYTVRELSNHAKELYALKSLNQEILKSGNGGGTPWHMEHLIDNYAAAWYSELPNNDADAALILNGFSRWINYYLEGMRWMFENYKIDGIYMDDVSFDRTIMKRIRKIIEKYRPEALVDLHSNTDYVLGSANQYADFMPYLDRLWFGEHFKYNKMDPYEWLVTFSGIPFGVMSEMLQDGGNPYLGALFGTTGRHSYTDKSPVPIWDLWKDFRIADSKMIGFWDDRNRIKIDNEYVKTTIFTNKDESLVVVGNFGEEDQIVNLNLREHFSDQNYNYSKVLKPYVKDFQNKEYLDLNNTISIPKKQSIILWLGN